MSNVGDGIEAGNARWSFSGESVDRFDEHVARSIPFYREGHGIVCDLSDFFIGDDSLCVELGCSTGSLSMALAERHRDRSGARFIGIDIETQMIDLAEQRKAAAGGDNLSFVRDDILQAELQGVDMIVAYYTVQFVRPSQRQLLFNRLYEALNWGGALLLFEKVRANDARFQDITTNLYQEYKLKQGYSPEEIVGKSRSLKGVLEPFSTQGNLDLMQRAGFVDVLSVFKYVCFEGFLAIK
ncbi:MAG: methyltransferase domain-containing protein [Pseudomonadota bacterium]